MTLLTIQDAADYLKMSTGYVKLAIRKGELKVARFGRAVRIHPDDLEVYRLGKIEGSTQSREESPRIRFDVPLSAKSIGYRP